jgi:hypothetical protein
MFIWKIDRADLLAVAAGVAFPNIDIARILTDLDPEISRPAGDALYVAKRDDFDVFIPGAFHQLGGKYAHGAIAGREYSVKLGHFPADGRRRIQQIDFETSVRQVQRCLNAADARTANQHRSGFFNFLIQCHEAA